MPFLALVAPALRLLQTVVLVRVFGPFVGAVVVAVARVLGPTVVVVLVLAASSDTFLAWLGLFSGPCSGSREALLRYLRGY